MSMKNSLTVGSGEDVKGHGISKIFRKMAEDTTLHGIPKIILSKHRYQRVLWAVLVLATTGYLVFQLWSLFYTFQSHPVKTKVSLEFSKLRFPAISFCNMNPIRLSMIKNASERVRMFAKKSMSTVQLQRAKRKKRSILGDLVDTVDNLLTGGRAEDTTNTLTEDVTNTMTNVVPNTLTSDIIKTLTNLTDPDVIQNTISNVADIISDVVEAADCDSWYECLLDGVTIPTIDYKNLTKSEVQILHALGWVDPSERDQMQLKQDLFNLAYLRMSEEVRSNIGHRLEDMLIDCALNTRKCTSTDFTSFTSPFLGNCFTLSPDTIIRRAGPSYGLRLTLNIEAPEYVPDLAEAFGVKLVIHEQKSFPFPVEEGVTISPGYETSIGLRLVEITRKGHPYGDCESGEQFRKRFGMRYSRTACIAMCRTIKVIEECQCRPHDNNFNLLNISAHWDVRVCNSLSPGDYICETTASERYDRGEIECQCNSPCRQEKYQQTISGRVWPNEYYTTKDLVDTFCNKSLRYVDEACKKYSENNATFDWSRFTQNFLRVVIYFEDLNYESITEEPLYDVHRFLSDLGGTLGLFLGASLMSMVEVIHLLLELVNYLRKKICRSYQVNATRVAEASNKMDNR